LGSNGEIVGILFGELRAHQPEGTNNKILWVAKNGDGSLHIISAQLEGSDTTATRTVNMGLYRRPPGGRVLADDADMAWP
jgi:hypothetical protein